AQKPGRDFPDLRGRAVAEHDERRLDDDREALAFELVFQLGGARVELLLRRLGGGEGGADGGGDGYDACGERELPHSIARRTRSRKVARTSHPRLLARPVSARGVAALRG